MVADDNAVCAVGPVTAQSLVLDIQGVVIEISAPAEVASTVREQMGEAAAVADATRHPALRYRHEIRSDGTHRFVRRDGMTVAGDDASAAADALTDHLHTAVANRSTKGLFVHAGVFSIEDRLVLAPGPSHAGKSTLVAAAVRRGATYFSDEFAIVDTEGKVHPYPRPLSVRTVGGSKRLHPRTDLDGTVATGPRPVALILATRFESGISWQPESLVGARAALPIIANTIHARRQAESTMRIAAGLARKALVLEGPRGEAEKLLDELMGLLRSLKSQESNRLMRGTV